MTERDEQLAEVTELAWSATLGLEVERDSTFFSNGADGDSSRYSARIDIEGSEPSALLLDCPEELVRVIAGVMFDVDPAGAKDEDLADALGEMINVIAGNARCLYGDNATISLPDVRTGAMDNLESAVNEVSFLCQGLAFRLLALPIK